jgi:dihydropyrimidinase
VAGGVTTLMPYMRATESYLQLVPEWTRLVREHSRCDVAFHLQIQIRAHLDEITACHEQFGISSFKIHIDARRNPNFGLLPVDDGDAYLAMLAARDFGGIVPIHCENSEITRYLDEQARKAGRVGLQAWADVRPPLAEASDVNNVVFLAAQLGCRVLIVHVSSDQSLAAARRHGYDGVVTEALIHQLAVTAADTEARIGAAGKMNPPVRGQDEIEALWEAVADGRIDFVGTDDHVADHARLAAERSGEVDFWEAESAGPGIGIGTAMFLTEGLRRGVDIRTLVRLMSESPARVFGLQQKGSIAVGKDADLVLVDLATEKVVTAGSPTSVGLTVGEGLRFRGWPVMTLVRGEVVFDHDEVRAPNGTSRVVSAEPARGVLTGVPA